MLIRNLLTYTDVQKKKKNQPTKNILEKKSISYFFFEEEFHRFWARVRHVINVTKTICKSLQVLDFYLMLVIK